MGSPRTGIRRQLIGAAVLRAALLGTVLAAALLIAPAAQAFSSPEVFLKEVDPSNHTIGDWIPLAGATMHSVNRYEVGARIQDTGQPDNPQQFLVQVNSVPNGAAPTQPDIYPECLTVTGTAGQIVDLTEDVRYQGDGPYSLTVTITPASGDASHGCTLGPSTTSSFTASAPTTAKFLGHMITDNPIATMAFNGLEVFPALGAGGSDVICARDPHPAPDGTLTGSLIITQAGEGNPPLHWTIHAAILFTQPGKYACVARSVGGGEVPGPWSAPTATETVQTGFNPKPLSWRLSGHGPVFKLTGHVLSPLAAGGKLKVTIRPVGRRGRHARPVRLSTRVGTGGKVSPRFRLPGKPDASLEPSFEMTFAYGGTKLVAARPTFGAFGLQLSEFPDGNRLQFTPPCGPQRC